jgi:hypothetical protein
MIVIKLLKRIANALILLVIVGLLSCSEGGIIETNNPFIDPDDVPKAIENTEVSGFVLYASQYERISNTLDAYTKTKENGLVYVGLGYYESESSKAIEDVAGNWDWAWYETPTTAEIENRQSFGKQWAHNTSLEEGDVVFINVRAPNRTTLDLSESDTLIIQMGNGADSDNNTDNGSSNPQNSHQIFTVTLNGGTQDSTYNWDNSCSTDQVMSSSHQFGLSTYYLELSQFECSVGDLDSLKSKTAEVVLKVIGGKDSAADASTSNNKTMLRIGYIGFSTQGAVGSNKPSPYVLFASQYESKPQASGDPMIRSKEAGDVTKFVEGTRFSHTGYGVDNETDGFNKFQAYGQQFNHNQAVDSNDSFGWRINGPGNGSVNLTATDQIVLQVGNAQQSEGSFAALNSHMVFTIELNNNSGNTCSYDLQIENSTRPGPAGKSQTGLRSYYIELSQFDGSNCDLNELKKEVHQVVIKVIGGKSNGASSSTSGNETFPIFGFIGFTEL